MKSLTKRLLLTSAALPLLAIVIFFLPWFNYLAWALCVIIMSSLGTMEAANFFRKKGVKINPVLALVAGGIIPLTTYLQISGILPDNALLPVVLILMGIFLTIETVIKKEKDIPGMLFGTAASLFIIFYPGFFFSYLIRIATFTEPSLYISCFLILVFGNDSLAYIIGSLLGKNSRKPFIISPNKSIPGFIGGFIGTLVLSAIWWFFLPEIFGGSITAALITGAAISIFANIGDLIESGLKRSAEIKDSGNLIPGRGGVLDSIDSILFCAPVFFYLIRFVTERPL